MSNEDNVPSCVLCGSADNLRRCARCKVAVYCCKEHQLADWPKHKSDCRKYLANGSIKTEESNVKTRPDKNTVKSFEDQKDVQKDSLTENDDKVSSRESCQNENTSSTESKICESQKKNVADKTKSSTCHSKSNGSKDDRIVNADTDNDDFIPFDNRPYKEIDFEKPPSYNNGTIANFVAYILKKNNFCVVDGIFEDKILKNTLSEINGLESDSQLKHGQLAGGRTSGQDNLKVTNSEIRSDKIMWLEGNEEHLPSIATVVKRMDSILTLISNNIEELNYHINGRTKAMVACYPGNGTYYRRHVDNPNKDGRLVTCILYLNEDWDVKTHGGLLRIFPDDNNDDYNDVAPIYNRMLFFWSDRRNPHEVQPAFKTRYAITVWFFDQLERQKAKEEEVTAELEKVQDRIALLEMQKKEMEKAYIEQQMENAATKAIQSLDEQELEALTLMIENHPEPKLALSSLGITSNIQDALIALIRERSAKSSVSGNG